MRDRDDNPIPFWLLIVGVATLIGIIGLIHLVDEIRDLRHEVRELGHQIHSHTEAHH